MEHLANDHQSHIRQSHLWHILVILIGVLFANSSFTVDELHREQGPRKASCILTVNQSDSLASFTSGRSWNAFMAAEQDSRGDMRRRLGSDTAVEMQREGSATSLSSWVLTCEAPYRPGYTAASSEVPTPPEPGNPLHGGGLPPGWPPDGGGARGGGGG